MPSAIAVPPICALADEQSDDPRDLWRCDQSSGNLQTLTQRFKNGLGRRVPVRSEEHTSELQSLMRISYAVFCLKKNKQEKRKRIKWTKLTVTTPNISNNNTE